MIEIKQKEKMLESDYKFIGDSFEEHAKDNGIVCAYEPFSFVAEEDGEVIGMITGNTYYKEVHVGDLIVSKEKRHNHVGSRLLQTVEEHFKDKGFENMNLSTYAFQAPEFYKKCGFKVEHIRECESEPKLNKYYMVKKI
jgi:ribosomal protein S18 acetylase RimI-like enzyme